MTLRDLMRMILESEIDLDTEINFCIIKNEVEYEYYTFSDNIVDYNDGTCAIIGKRK